MDSAGYNPLPLVARRMDALKQEVIEIVAAIVKGEDDEDDS